MAFPDPPPEINDNMLVLKLRAQWTLGHQGRGESAWHFVCLNAGAPTQMAFLWDLWESTCKSLWASRRPTVWTFDRVIIEDRFPAEEPELIMELNEPGLGPGADSVPPQLGPLISWRTAWPGRSYRGRTYWGPFLRDDLEESFVSGPLTSVIEDYAEAMLHQFGVAARSETEPHFAIISRQHDGVPEPVGRWADVEYNMPVRVMATNRRRLRWWDL